MMKTLLSRIILVLFVGVLASCSNDNDATSSSDALARKINMSKLTGWTGEGNEGIYMCVGTAACPAPKLAIYQALAASEAELSNFRNVDKDPRAAEQEFKKTLSIFNSDSGGALETVGISQRVVANGINGTGYTIKGKTAGGLPRAPGYSIMFPGISKVHVFLGIGNTDKEAKEIAVMLSNAWTPKP